MSYTIFVKTTLLLCGLTAHVCFSVPVGETSTSELSESTVITEPPEEDGSCTDCATEEDPQMELMDLFEKDEKEPLDILIRDFRKMALNAYKKNSNSADPDEDDLMEYMIEMLMFLL